MHKTIRRRSSSSGTSSSQSPSKRALQLSKETIRALSSTELTQAASGCPTGSTTTQIGVDTETC